MEQQIEEYIDYISRNNQKTENTLLSYRRDLYKLMTYLCDELNIHEWGIVTQTDLNSYILHLQKGRYCFDDYCKICCINEGFF